MYNDMYKIAESEVAEDLVNHPKHYKSKNGLETIDVIEAFTENLKGIEATDTGNILKYMCRWKEKNGLQDLEKARWYLNHLIDHVEKKYKEFAEKVDEHIYNELNIPKELIDEVYKEKETKYHE